MTDREKVIRLIEEEINVCESVNQCYRTIDLPVLRDIHALLKEQNNCENCAIAIEDRQPVVRCKDCKHFHDMKCSYPARGTCDLWHMLHWGEWFCADGERRLSGNEQTI